MVLEVNEKEEQMVSTAYTTQKGFYRGTELESPHVTWVMWHKSYDSYDMSRMKT